jgi:hypothetical protein
MTDIYQRFLVKDEIFDENPEYMTGFEYLRQHSIDPIILNYNKMNKPKDQKRNFKTV